MEKELNISQSACLAWLHSACFENNEATLVVTKTSLYGRTAIFRQVDPEDMTAQRKLRLIAEFCRDLLNVRVTHQAVGINGLALYLNYLDSVVAHVPFSNKEDLKKFWLAHIKHSITSEMCKLRSVTQESQAIIAFRQQLLEEMK